MKNPSTPSNSFVEMFDHPGNTPLQLLEDDVLSDYGVKLYIKREDLIHSEISGNKWRKLKYNFLEAERLGFRRILTCGGAFSNHISAAAAAAALYGFESTGIIRGDPYEELNPTLSFAESKGMKFLYWNREKYRKGLSDENLQSLKKELGDFYFIPEGGTNDLAVKGTSEIVLDINIPFDFICCSVGTGGTLAGLIKGQKPFDYQSIGFSALKNTGFLEEAVIKLIGNEHSNWMINNDYSFGGYAKFSTELINFINAFYVQYKLELDPIYTGKMMFGLFDLIRKGYFKPGSVIVAVHTGGLQGKAGFNKRFKNILL